MDEMKQKYLTNKRTLLSVPGNLKTDAYYTESDATVHLTELTANLGRYTQSLSTNQIGSTGQIIIPNQDILGECYLHLRLPATAGTSTAGVWTAPQGWGWSAIKSISYLWGASNVSQITISGKSLWSIALAQCGTEEKRAKLNFLGGSSLPAITQSATVDTNDVEDIEYDCYLPLALPWSVMCHEGKIGYDTSLLNSPITIQIGFAPRDEFIQWSSALVDPIILSKLPTTFEVAEVVIRQQMFSDRSQSLKFEMQNNPELVYNYPFKHYQSFQKDFTATTGVSTQVQLNNFINADLIGMVVFVVEKSKLVGGSTAIDATSTPYLNPLDISLPKNVKLLFNGQVLYNSPGKLYLLQNCAGLNGGGSYYAALSKLKTSGTGLLSLEYKPIIRDMIFIDFSRKHSLCFEHEYENTFRIAQQTLDLELTMNKDAPYTLFATYIYNGVNATQQGASNLYFD